MTLNDTIDLVAITKMPDSEGYSSVQETKTAVKCDSGKGVTRSEFYEAMKAGLQLSAAFEMWACDYGGQKHIEHNGKRYKVERAYPMGNGTIQLNCSEETR